MAGTTLAARLKGLAKTWAGARTRAKQAQGVPDNSYIGRLSDCAIDETGKELRFKMVFTILEGEYAGEFLNKQDGMEGPDSLYYIGRTLSRLGYDPEEVEIEQLPAIAKELKKEKPVCKLSARTKEGSDFQNVFVNGTVEDYDDSQESGSNASEEEETGADETEEEEGTEESAELAVGSRVSFSFRGEDITGAVLELIEDDTKARVQRDDTGKVIVKKVEDLAVISGGSEEPADEEEEEETPEPAAVEEEEVVELAVGMRVKFPWKGNPEETGEVTDIPNDTQAKVRKDSDGKIATVLIEKLEELAETADETEEEEEEAPAPPPPAPKPAGRKPAPSPAPAAPARKPATRK